MWLSISLWLLPPAPLLLWRNVNLFLVCVIKPHPVRFDPVVQKCVMKTTNPPEPLLSHKRKLFKVGARFRLAAQCFLASQFKMSASSCHRLLPDLIKILGRRDFGWDRAPFSTAQTDVNTNIFGIPSQLRYLPVGIESLYYYIVHKHKNSNNKYLKYSITHAAGKCITIIEN